jgi:hypothetical protein
VELELFKPGSSAEALELQASGVWDLGGGFGTQDSRRQKQACHG